MKQMRHQTLFWYTIPTSGLMILIIAVVLWLGYRQADQWQFLALAAMAGAVAVAYGVAVWAAYTRERFGFSFWLITSAQILGVMLVPLFLADFWLIGLLILATVPLKIGISGQLHRMPHFVILALLGASVLTLCELLALPGRPTILAVLSQYFYLFLIVVFLYGLALIFALWYFRLRPGTSRYVRSTLTTQLALLLTAISALSIFVATGVLITQIHEIQIKTVGQDFQTKAQVEAERVGNILERQIIDLANLGQAPDIQDRLEEVTAGYPYGDEAALRSYLQAQDQRWQEADENSDFVLLYRTSPAVMVLTAFRGNHNSHRNLFVTNRMGGLVAAHGEKPERFYYGDEDWWRSVWDLGQGGVYMGRLVVDPRTKNASIFLAVRVVSPKTYEPALVMASTYDLQAVQQIIDLANENSSRAVRLLSAGGVVLAGPDKAEIGQRLEDLPANILTAGPPGDAGVSSWLLDREKGAVLAYSTLSSTSQTNLSPLRRLNWYVVVSDTQASALAELYRSTQVASLAALLVLMGIVVMANGAAKVITRPIKELTAVAREINEGNLDLKAKPSGPQEFVTLAETFNHLTTRLNTFINSLRQSERRYRTLFEDSKDAIYLTDPNGQIIDVNPAGLSLFGYTREEAQQGNVSYVYANAADRLRFQEEMTQQGSVRDFELRLRRKDGSEVDCLVTATIRQADDGTVMGYQGILRDITAQKQAERERLRLSAIQRELDMARNIQVSLLPPTHPQWSGPDVVCYSKPADEIGGDFYAYHALSGKYVDGDTMAGGFALVVGDISGKGMPAALLMAVSLASLQTVINHSFSPAELLAHLDGVLAHYTHTTRQNCALCYVEITPSWNGTAGKLHVANAGCIAPIIRRADGPVEWIEVGGLPLGVGLGAENGYQEASLDLASHDLVILISDGVLEAMNEAGEIFGFERMEQAVATGPTTGAEAMLEHLKTRLAGFVGTVKPHDDVTMVVVHV